MTFQIPKCLVRSFATLDLTKESPNLVTNRYLKNGFSQISEDVGILLFKKHLSYVKALPNFHLGFSIIFFLSLSLIHTLAHTLIQFLSLSLCPSCSLIYSFILLSLSYPLSLLPFIISLLVFLLSFIFQSSLLLFKLGRISKSNENNSEFDHNCQIQISN
jgi:hypothetical protein